MRPEVIAAERKTEVRRAARTWKYAGWISEAAEAAIRQHHADDRQRLGPALRILLFLLTCFGVASGFGTILGFVAALAQGSSDGLVMVLTLAMGIGCVLVAELAYGRFRLLGYGVESALSWCGVGYTLAGLLWMVFEVANLEDKTGLFVALFLAALVFGLGAWRWGSWLMAFFSGGALLGIFAGLPLGRLGWLLLGGLTARLLLTRSENGRFSPSHRRCWLVLLGLAVFAVSFALFPTSNEKDWVEDLGLRTSSSSPIPVVLAWLGSAALAGGLVVFGVRTRRRLLLTLGVLFAATLLALLAAELDLKPYWALLCGTGLLLIGAPLLLRRFLDAGENHERNGFSAAALLEDPESRALLEAATVMATASPGARQLPAQQSPGFQGQGGQFGGGGASADF